MKKFFILAIVAGLFAACGGPKGEQAEVDEAHEIDSVAGVTGEYMVDAQSSILTWVGAKFAYQHTGTVGVKGGSFQVKEDAIVGGKFIIDMTTIDVTDITEEEDKQKFIGHMTTGDFFTVDSFPTAEFEIEKLEALESAEVDSMGLTPTHKVMGNLTIKGITKSVAFDAKVGLDPAKITAETSQFLIDRTLWNIVFNSATALEDVAKDNIIKDEIGITLKIEAKKEEEMAAN